MDTKLAWLSKTWWLGLLTALYGLLSFFVPLPIPLDTVLAAVTSIWGFLVMFLRYISKDKIVLLP